MRTDSLREDERGELERVAEARRLTMSDAMRQLIREEAQRAGLARKIRSKK